MNFKRIVLLTFIVCAIIPIGFGLVQKTRSARLGDDPYPSTQEDYPSPDNDSLKQQVGNTFSIILGAIAIVIIIGAGVGYNCRVPKQ